MIKKANRLTRKKDFDAVWQKGRSSFDKIFGVKVLSSGLQANRFGIMAGLKFSKKAVERNKIKRRIREIIGAEENNFKKGFDIAITAMPAARQKKFSELQESLLKNFKRLGITNN
ncbi:MAG: ribonuclease P protein component [Patescibacteria group bacterium]|nr:ribonuclease P protein component [Patescibacteria group bacterium]